MSLWALGSFLYVDVDRLCEFASGSYREHKFTLRSCIMVTCTTNWKSIGFWSASFGWVVFIYMAIFLFYIHRTINAVDSSLKFSMFSSCLYIKILCQEVGYSRDLGYLLVSASAIQKHYDKLPKNKVVDTKFVTCIFYLTLFTNSWQSL